MRNERGNEPVNGLRPRRRWRAAAVGVVVVVVVAAAGVLLSQGDGDPKKEAVREPGGPATQTAPQPRTTPEAESTPRVQQPEPRRAPTTRERRRRGERAARIRRSYTPEPGEAVVPNKPQCTGPDVFDQPGCETVAAP